MFKKSNIKSFIIGSICTAILMTSVSSIATGKITKNISVLYNNMKIVVDGKKADLGKDLAGDSIEPFVYEGTTYLPVRAVGEALGKKVTWDSKTQTVYLGEVPGQSSNQYSYLTEVLPSVTNGGETYKLENKEEMKMGGKTYKTGFFTKGLGKFIYFNLDGKYTEITGEIGSMGTSNRENDLEIFLDDKPYKTIKISGDKSPEKITIPVSGVNQVKFANNSDQGIYYLHFGLGDFKIK